VIDMALPFQGLSILEAASAASPPGLAAAIALCGRVAADLGACVLRWIPADDADPQAAAFLHAGKTGMRAAGGKADALLADLGDRVGAAILDSALHASLGPDRTPRICVVVSMDGTDDLRQSEFTVEARSGLLDIVGDPGREPLRLGGHQTAYGAGLAAFTALAAAVAAPETAERTVAHVSLLETAIWLNWKSLAVTERSGRPPRRPGAAAEWPVLACADGHVALVYRMQEWQRLLEAIPDPSLRDERFQSVAGRRANRVEINAILARNVARLTRMDLHALALRYKLPFGPIWRPQELLDDPQMRARDFFSHQAGGATPRLPVLWNGARLRGSTTPLSDDAIVETAT
jgi:crotonobetainyl-CoA:carnitine CoA-transferase CaiB-like acyl-CoA transferase